MNNQIPQGPAFEPVSNNKPIRALFSRAGFFAFTFLASAQIFSFLLAVIYLILFGEDYLSHGFYCVASAVQYAAALPFCYLIMRGVPKRPVPRKKLKGRYLFAAFTACILFAQIGSMLGLFSSDLLSQLFGFNIMDPLTQEIGEMSVIENIVVLGILAPFFEEFLFRKLLLDRITVYGGGIAIFISAMLFALVHCNIYQFFYAFFIGILFGYLYLKTGSLRCTILLHSLFNLFSGVLPEFLSGKVQEFNPALIFVNGFQAAYLAYTLLFFALLVTGLVLMIVWHKKYSADMLASIKNLGEYFSPAALNAGMIMVFLASIIICLVNIFTLR